MNSIAASFRLTRFQLFFCKLCIIKMNEYDLHKEETLERSYAYNWPSNGIGLIWVTEDVVLTTLKSNVATILKQQE